jgi:hypothetical protein
VPALVHDWCQAVVAGGERGECIGWLDSRRKREELA